MSVDHQESNKVVPPIHVAAPNIATILDTLAMVLGQVLEYHAVLPDNQEADSLAQVWALATDSAADTEDWVHKKGGHCTTQVGWHIAKGAGLPLKYSDWFNAVAACLVCSKQCLRQLPKESGTVHRVPNK